MHPIFIPRADIPTLLDHDRRPTLKIVEGDRLSIPVTAHDSDRGLVLSSRNRGDLVAFHPDDFFCADWLVRHQTKAGLKPGLVIRQPNSYGDLDLDKLHISPFIFNPEVNQFQPDEHRLLATQAANTKNWLLPFAESLGVRIPKTIYCQNKNHLDLRQINKLGDYPVFLKISTEYSFTGNGVFCVNNEAELTAKLELISTEVPFQIQEDLRKKGVIAFPNLQYWESGGKVKRLLLTNQVLSGNEHCGNCHDSDFSQLHAKAWAVVDRLAQSLADKGLRWIFAFDLAICLDNGHFTYYLVECNGRPNGSTYATAVASNLPGYSCEFPWTAKTVAINKPLEQIDLGSLIYSSRTRSGIVPHIASTAKKGKIGVTFLGTHYVQRELENKLTAILQ